MANVPALLAVPGLEAEMPRIEDVLHRSVGSSDPFLTEVAAHLLKAGGKRLRPALAVAGALAGGVPTGTVPDEVVLGGVAVELVHLGSLYHDDVIDEATTRHGVESANARWGNVAAILAGDFLLARASEIAASLGTEVAGLLGQTIGRLCEGEVGQLKTTFDAGRTEEAYLASISGKTASLLSAACRVGALTAALEQTTTDALTLFGERFGIVFQIYDDVLDLVSTEEELGKPVGSDLVEGVYTLPVIRALADPVAGAELRPLLGAALEPDTRDRARDIVCASRGVDEAVRVARGYADQAAAALAPMGERPGAAALAGLGHRLLDLLPL